jgi:hypothetical protein
VEVRQKHKILVGKPEGKRRLRRKWEENIKIGFRELRLEGS